MVLVQPVKKIKIGQKEPLNVAAPKINTTIDLVNNFQSQIDQIVVEGSIDPETAQARVEADGTVHTTLKERLDVENNEVSSQLADTMTLKPSGVNDKTTWNNAVNSLANGGQINLTNGDYYIDRGILKSDMVIHGRGFPRILSDDIIFIVNSGSPDSSLNINNITFEYIVFESITKTFSEFIHMFSLSGVSEVTFKRCIFKGFRGDGVYLGSGDAGQERHNENVYFEKCIFDGVNNDNRNAISIIDGDGIHIDECVFKNCTRSTMPGAINLEPNLNNWHIIQNVTCKKSKFRNIGGNVGVFSLHLPLDQKQLLTPIGNIVFENNEVNGTIHTQSGFYIRQVQGTAIDDSHPDINIKVTNNRFKNISKNGFILRGAKGVSVKQNEFNNFGSGIVVGYTETTDKCMNIKVTENTFKKSGYTDARALAVFEVENLDIIKNLFEDCGRIDGTVGAGVFFHNGTSKNVRLIENDFISPLGRMKSATRKIVGHTFTKETNADQNNRVNGLVHQFDATLRDTFYSLDNFDGTTLPDSFYLGVSTTLVNGSAGLPSGITQGVIVTHKLNREPNYRKFITEWFYPAQTTDVISLTNNYYRRGNISTNDWSAWYTVSGTQT